MLDLCNFPSELLMKLGGFECHPFIKLIKDFGLDHVEDMLDGSYLYVGPIDRNSKKDIAILHFHSSLDKKHSFADIQNLHAYEKIKGLPKTSLVYLSLNIDRDNVVDLGKNNALNTYVLNNIYLANRFVIVDQTGYAKEYNWER